MMNRSHQMLSPALCLVAILASAWSAAAGEFPDDWFFLDHNDKRPADHLAFEGKAMPDLNVKPWINGEMDASQFEGKILVLDFWATWCQPCIAAFPHNNQMYATYKDQGVLFLGVCAEDSADQMSAIVKKENVAYPNAFVDGQQVSREWPLQWFPTYAVVDATGTVRAIGLKPNAVTDVIDALLAESVDNDGKARIPGYWLEGDAESRSRLSKLIEAADNPPALELTNWINSDPMQLDQLQGKVVVLSFGATWASPWLDSIDQLNDLQETYGDEGLQIIGICSSYEGYALPDIAKKFGIDFPVAVDVENRTNRAYGPNNFPDLYVIDRFGTLRIADLKSDNLESAIKALLAEEVVEAEDEAENSDNDAAVDAADGDADEAAADANADAIDFGAEGDE